MRKRALILILIGVLTIFTLGFTEVAKPLYYKIYPLVNIMVNQKEILPAEGDVPAFQIDGRTMVPIRLVAEALKADVKWDEGTRTVIITKEEYTPPAAPVELKNELINFKNYQLNSSQTRLTGIILNKNEEDVDIEFIIDFYDRHNKYLGHVHVRENDIDFEESRVFEAELPEEIRNYSRVVNTIERLEVN